MAHRLVHSQLELPEHASWDVSWNGQLHTTESAASARILHLARIELATFSVRTDNGTRNIFYFFTQKHSNK